MLGLVVHCPLAVGGRFFRDTANAPSCDMRTVLEDPTPCLRVRLTGIPLRHFGSPSLASSRYMDSTNADPDYSRQTRGAGLGGVVRSRIHGLSKQNVVLA
jgi:hypothetical protein